MQICFVFEYIQWQCKFNLWTFQISEHSYFLFVYGAAVQFVSGVS